jgi:hypothetical protein
VVRQGTLSAEPSRGCHRPVIRPSAFDDGFMTEVINWPGRCDTIAPMERDVVQNRIAWETASQKHPAVVHPQSGHGLEDIALVTAGAQSVVGVDFSEVAAAAAQRRADDLGLDARSTCLGPRHRPSCRTRTLCLPGGRSTLQPEQGGLGARRGGEQHLNRGKQLAAR